MTAPARPGGAGPLAWASLAVLYVLWGSTYLAIRIDVRVLPPATFAATRFLLAGALLYPIAIRQGGPELRRADRPGRAQWLGCAVAGTLLITVGNGAVSVAEQHLDSGLVAVLVATIPLWVVVLSALLAWRRPAGLDVAAVLLGLVGVAVLVAAGGASGHPGSVLVVLTGPVGWALGMVTASRLPLPRRVLLASSLEMLGGGAVLAVVGALRGEYAQVDLARTGPSTWLAFAWLVFGGSMLAFTAYGYAVTHLPLSTVATYAYVNPLIAVLLGAVIEGERLSGRELVGTAVIVASVALTLARARISAGVAARRSRRASQPARPGR